VRAASATPFDDDRFDAAIFRENMRRLPAAGVHGHHTTDSDGEFYAIELAEYKWPAHRTCSEERQVEHGHSAAAGAGNLGPPRQSSCTVMV
jgi:dihydrodipicolinate synthase/N-acetylneuraminate lyase